jgi:hypothetical protein
MIIGKNNFKERQTEYYSGFGTSFAVTTNQTLHSSFHPVTYASTDQGDEDTVYIVKLDQVHVPEGPNPSRKDGSGDHSHIVIDLMTEEPPH